MFSRIINIIFKGFVSWFVVSVFSGRISEVARWFTVSMFSRRISLCGL